MPPTNDWYVLDDPFGELQETELLASPPTKCQCATIDTETGAETSIVFPDGQDVTVTILGQARVTIELPVRPAPTPNRLVVIEHYLSIAHLFGQIN